MTKKLLPLLALVFIFGCGSGKVPLGGTVTFSDDGSPVPLGSVSFSTPTFSASGTISVDGTYVIGTDTLSDGIPKGTYEVSVYADETIEIPPRTPDGTPDYKSTSLIDPKYNHGSTSGLTFTVDGKNKKFDIQVDRAK
jgi:hypothetical protein